MNSGIIVISSDVGGDWNMTFIFFISLGKFTIPTDELIFLRGVGIPPVYVHINKHIGNIYSIACVDDGTCFFPFPCIKTM